MPKLRYVWLYFRLFLIFNLWISLNCSVQKLWHDLAFRLTALSTETRAAGFISMTQPSKLVETLCYREAKRYLE